MQGRGVTRPARVQTDGTRSRPPVLDSFVVGRRTVHHSALPLLAWPY